jgi:methylmalonyl-CoA/ethylmalonyl-CoA epimerase
MNHGVNSIHHINFLVRDLDQAETRYRELLGLGPALRDDLPGRGVKTARFRLGETWLVLVQPTSQEGEPARHLREHGEGFFLLSFGVEDMGLAMERVMDNGGSLTTAQPRRGLDGWQVIDIDPATSFGAALQLTEE